MESRPFTQRDDEFSFFHRIFLCTLFSGKTNQSNQTIHSIDIKAFLRLNWPKLWQYISNQLQCIHFTKKTMCFLVFIAAFFVNQATLNQASSSIGWFSTEANQPMASPVISPNSFDFPSFSYKSCSPNSELICSGSTTARKDYIRLTNANKTSEVGKVLFRYPMTAWPTYVTTSFTIRIKLNRNTYESGDGMTFIIASDNSPASEHDGGFDLGLMEDSKKGTKNLRQIAVALDTYKNGFDKYGNQIAIITNKVKNPIIAKSLDSIGVQLTSGKKITVQIEYNTLTKWLQISVGHSSESLVKFLSIPIDIKAIVSKPIYVGFTAATGTLSESHEVHSWDFKASHNNHTNSS